MKKTDQLAKPGETGSVPSHMGSGDQQPSQSRTCQSIEADRGGESLGHGETQTVQSSDEGVLHDKGADSSELLHHHTVDASQLGATGVDLNKLSLKDS